MFVITNGYAFFCRADKRLPGNEAKSYTDNQLGQTLTLIEHWNGSQWKIVTNPNPGSYVLWAVAADTTGRAVAVGVYIVNFGPGRTLAEVHDA